MNVIRRSTVSETGIISLTAERSRRGHLPWRERVRKTFPGIISLGTVAILWQLSSIFFASVATPSLQTIASTMWSIVTDWDQLSNLMVTGARILAGLIVAFTIGILVGVLMGLNNVLQTYVRPTLYFIQGIPALSWVVFAVLWFTETEVRVIFILVMVTFPNFALFIESAVRAVPQDLRELGQAFRASRWDQFRLVVLPQISPAILSSWSVNLGNGVRAVVVAELVGATFGVGNRLLLAQSLFDMAAAMAWTLLLVLMLLLFQTVLNLIESRVMAWRPIGERS